MRFSVLFLLFLASAPMAGQIYKSVDAEGKVVYSSRRPAGGAGEDVSLPSGPTADQVESARQRLIGAQEAGDKISAERATAPPPASSASPRSKPPTPPAPEQPAGGRRRY